MTCFVSLVLERILWNLECFSVSKSIFRENFSRVFGRQVCSGWTHAFDLLPEVFGLGKVVPSQFSGGASPLMAFACSVFVFIDWQPHVRIGLDIYVATAQSGPPKPRFMCTKTKVVNVHCSQARYVCELEPCTAYMGKDCEKCNLSKNCREGKSMCVQLKLLVNFNSQYIET